MVSWYGVEIPDSFGSEFFRKALFRSPYFVISSFAFVALLVYWAWFAVQFWPVYHHAVVLVSFLLFARCLNSFAAGIMRHRAVREQYFAAGRESAHNESTGLMGVAARAILDDLFYTPTIVILVLFIFARLLHHST